jgi:hypothetical protein
MTQMDKLMQVVSNDGLLKKFLVGTKEFGNNLKDSTELETAFQNLATNIQAPNESNVFTDDQKKKGDALTILRNEHRALYNNAFPDANQRITIKSITDSMSLNQGIREATLTANKLNDIDTKNAKRFSGKDLMEHIPGLSSAPSNVSDEAFTHYKEMLKLGHDEALQSTKSFMRDMNPKVNNRTISYGGSWEKLEGYNLEDALKTLNTSYVSGGVAKSGVSALLADYAKNTKSSSGNTLFNLDQVPYAEVSIRGGALVIQTPTRLVKMTRDAMRIELNGYNERAEARRANDRARRIARDAASQPKL